MPKFRDSRDVMELLFSGKIADKTRVDCFEALRHTSETFHEAHNFFNSAEYRKPYWKWIVKYSAHFVAYFSF